MYDDEIKLEFLKKLDSVKKKLLNYLLALTRSIEDAEDILQDSILAAYQGYEKLKEKEAFAGYIFKIAKRTYQRKKWRMRFFGAYNSEWAENIIDPNAKTDLAAETKLLYQALNEIDFKYKNAIILFEIAGFSIKEIAEMEKENENTIKTRLRRGREKLSQILGVNKKNKQVVYQLNLNDAV